MNSDPLYQIYVLFIDGSEYRSIPKSLGHCQQTQRIMIEKEKARFFRFNNGFTINLNNIKSFDIVPATQESNLRKLAKQLLEDFDSLP